MKTTSNKLPKTTSTTSTVSSLSFFILLLILALLASLFFFYITIVAFFLYSLLFLVNGEPQVFPDIERIRLPRNCQFSQRLIGPKDPSVGGRVKAEDGNAQSVIWPFFL